MAVLTSQGKASLRMAEKASDPAAIRVTRLLRRAVRAGFVPGATAMWQTGGGEPMQVTVGQASLVPRPRPLSSEYWFDLASLTKPLVTTTLFLFARRQGLLDLSTRLAELMPGQKSFALAEVTLGHLLAHTSGLPAWLPLYAMATQGPDHARELLCRQEPVHRPGEHVVYSCPGFILLGMVLEEVLGVTLDLAFRRLVLEPLGLSGEAGFDPVAGEQLVPGSSAAVVETALVAEMGLDPGTVPHQAHGLPDDGNARFLGGASGNAGLFGTARGVLELARQYVPGEHSLLSGEEIATAVQNHTPGLEQARGLGWQLAATEGCSAGPALSPAAHGHTGFTGTSLWIDPARGAVLILLSHRHHPIHRGVDLHPLRRAFHATVLS